MEKKIILYTSRKYYQHVFIWAIISSAILVGIGLYFYILHQIKSHFWELLPTSIRIHQGHEITEISVSQLIKAETLQSKREKKAHLATLQIDSQLGRFQIHGVNNAEKYKTAINEAIRLYKIEENRKITVRPEEHNHLAIGGLDRMNDLVGLWQAGMISDEDFFREQEKFKRNDE